MAGTTGRCAESELLPRAMSHVTKYLEGVDNLRETEK